MKTHTGGVGVTISSPDKVLFPEDGISKGELAVYYRLVAPLMLPHVRCRPLTMERFPDGIGAPGFFHKDVVRGFPEWLERIELPKKGGRVHHPLLNDARAVLWAANQNCITPHVSNARAPALRPDLCVLDLDPADDSDPAALRTAALQLRRMLDELSLPSWIKTTGSKGFHIVVPLDGEAAAGEVARFARAVGQLLVRRAPRALTQELSKVDRGGRILVDTGRNGFPATYAAPYAVRPRRGAPVSAPCSWEEVEEVEEGSVHPQSFRLRDMAARTDAVGDLWLDLHENGQPLGDAVARLAGLAARMSTTAISVITRFLLSARIRCKPRS